MNNGWIDSTKELPKIGEPVLVYILDAETEQKMYTGRLLYVRDDGARYWDINCKNIGIMQWRFIFWMPLPDSPVSAEVEE